MAFSAGCVNTGAGGNLARQLANTIQQSDTALKQEGGFLLYQGQKFTGHVVRLQNIDTLYYGYYNQGKQEGWEYQRHTKGQLAEQRYYKEGKKEGEHKAWYKNGKPRFVYHYKNDVYEGNVKEWIESGQLMRDFNYKKGHENGRQRLWYADGRVLANYDVRNGRKYGFTGVKNCVSVWEERENE